ncbi:MAG: alanine dehydrogenase [Flavobacteriales bacterium]|nr:alanine dehydrogenase [Flavobacteriales bacterium]NNK81109.1 alanine dehydrogenase [Flavobacteriales bacterium]
MENSGKAMRALAQEAMLMPQEEMLEVGRKKSSLYIGIPKETSYQETRVALTPQAVEMLVNNGHRVIIQRGAGNKANFTDHEYSEAGAGIGGIKEVFEADIILKIAPPTDKEIELIQDGQTVMTALQLNLQLKETLVKLMKKRVTAIAWDFIQDEGGIFPIVRTMSEIAGNTSILIAAELLSNFEHGVGIMFGGIAGVKPSEVVILGAGTVGEFAARAALGLGASVKVFDSSISKLRRLQDDVGQRVYTSVVDPTVLSDCLRSADVVIGAIRSKSGRTPVIVTEAMIRNMKKGSVIVDVSIDRGGCFETSRMTDHENPTYICDDVVHYCVPNIASRVPRTASRALSNIFAPVVLEMSDVGGCKNLVKYDQGFRNGVYLYQGVLTSELLGEAFDLPHKNIELLLAAF